MNINLEPGTYVLAVSGGVDSAVLLNILSQRSDLKLVVAHLNHGIRKDSDLDRLLVEQLAKNYKLPFVFSELHMGSNLSEAVAREKRYEFLQSIRQKYKANAIVTAHHQDDVLETAILNLLRGTNRLGLSSLKSTAAIKRPLLDIPKSEIVTYAITNKLEWREDSTNDDDKYLRNYIRHQILPHFNIEDRKRLLDIIGRTKQINHLIDEELARIFLNNTASKLDRQWFLRLSYSTAKEIMAAWLRQNEVQNVSRSSVDHLVVAAKTLQPDKYRNVDALHDLKVTKRYLALLPSDR